jgi:hypothetical protein
MNQADDRAERFRADIEAMNLSGPTRGSNRDPVRALLGAAAMGLGLALSIVAYFLSHATTNVLSQNDDHILALVGVALAIVGTGVYLKSSLAQFLRFWLARFIYEQQRPRPE